VAHAQTYEAIVLMSYDVGEADRFLILLTRERGRIAARAPGVRRLKSRLSGLLPLARLSLDLREHGDSFLITAVHARTVQPHAKSLGDFLTGMQASEILLSLLHDEEPAPAIFDATATFLAMRNRQQEHLLSFTFRMLSLLGVLPLGQEIHLLGALSPEEKQFVEGSARGQWQEHPPALKNLLRLCTKLVQEHAPRQLKSADVAIACAG